MARSYLRRPMAVICAVALLSPALASAEEPRPAAALRAKPSTSSKWLGAMVDLGAPDILGASILINPWPWLRLHIGGSTNAVSGGIRGGITYVPFDYWVTPSVTVEAGHFFEGNANWITRKFGFESAVLDRVGYTYANAHLGLEFGSRNSFQFFVHGGFSILRTKIRNLQDVVREETGDSSVDFKDPTLRYIGPSAKLGFVFYLI